MKELILPDELLNQIKNEGFRIEHYNDGENDYYEIGKMSTYGHDFSFMTETEGDIDYFLDNILASYQDFDVSREAYLWLDDEGTERMALRMICWMFIRIWRNVRSLY